MRSTGPLGLCWIIFASVAGCGLAMANTFTNGDADQLDSLQPREAAIRNDLLQFQRAALARQQNFEFDCLDDLSNRLEIVSGARDEVSNLILIESAMRDEFDSRVVLKFIAFKSR